MRSLRGAAVCSLLLSTAGCLPDRDNPHDPSIRPRASFEVRVGEDLGLVGGRYADWVLRSTSNDPNQSFSSLDHSWYLSSGFAPTPSEVPHDAWIPIGEADELRARDENSPFGAALAEIRDFPGTDAGPTFGFVSRWIELEVDDGDHSDRAYAQIAVVNQPLSVDLGPDLRIAPGGKWWNLADPKNPGSAEKHLVRIQARVSDSDGDEGAAFTPAIPAIWSVTGDLAAILDLDGNGLVDEARLSVGSSGERSVVTFEAPLHPIGGSIAVDVGDILGSEGEPVYNARAEVNVEVRASQWVADRETNSIHRRSTSRLEVPSYVRTNSTSGLPHQRILAKTGAGDELFLIEGTEASGPIHAVVVDPRFRELRRRDNVFPNAPLGVAILRAVEDGLGGWWVYSSTSGTVVHLDATMTPTATVGNIDGTAASDIGVLAPALDGTGDVWNCFGDFTAADRLYRIRPNGTQAIATATAFPVVGSYCSSIAPDGTGGVWVGASIVGALRRFDATGALQLDEVVDSVTAMEFHAAGGDLWLVLEADTYEYSLTYRHFTALQPDGAAISIPIGISTLQPMIAVDPSTRLLTLAFDGLATPLVIDSDLQTVGFGSAFPQMVAIYMLAGGTLVGIRDFDTTNSFTLVSSEPNAISSALSVPVPELLDDPFRDAAAIVADGVNGSVWAFQVASGRLEHFGADGRLLESTPIDVTPGNPAIGARAALAIDQETRRLWLAWSRDPGEGKLLAFDLPEDPRTPLPVPADHTAASGYSVSEIVEIDAAAGGTVCVAGDGEGFLYRPGDGTFDAQIVATAFGFTSVVAESKPAAAPGGCFFRRGTDQDDPEFPSEFYPPETTYVDPSGARSVHAPSFADQGRGIGWDFWNQESVTVTHDFLATDLIIERWHPALGLATRRVLTPVDPVPGFIHDVDVDPYWGHIYVSAGVSPGFVAPKGAVVQFDGAMREIERDEFLAPRLALP